MDNAAFADDPHGEPARIMRHAAKVIEQGAFGMSPGANMPLRGVNGNLVGKAEVRE